MMKGDRIEIEDEWYVDTTAASELTGYAKDYVGQLARLGKVNAKQLGRAWYVNEKSLLKHKKDAQSDSADSPEIKKSSSRVEIKKAIKSTQTEKKEKVPVSVQQEEPGPLQGVGSDATNSNPSIRDGSLMDSYSTKKVSGERDPLLHTSISFHPDGPVEYRHDGGFDMPVLQKKERDAVDVCDVKHGEYPMDFVGSVATGSRQKVAQHADLALQNKTVSQSKNRNIDEVKQKNVLAVRVTGTHFSALVHAPYTTSTVFGVFVGCCVALLSIL